MSGEAVKVVVRSRPLNGKEKREDRKPIVTMKLDLCQVGLCRWLEEEGEQVSQRTHMCLSMSCLCVCMYVSVCLFV